MNRPHSIPLTDQALGRPYKLALQLLLVTCGQRPKEVIGAPLNVVISGIYFGGIPGKIPQVIF